MRALVLAAAVAALLAAPAQAQWFSDGGGECPHTGWVYGGGLKWFCNNDYQVIEGPYIA